MRQTLNTDTGNKFDILGKFVWQPAARPLSHCTAHLAPTAAKILSSTAKSTSLSSLPEDTYASTRCTSGKQQQVGQREERTTAVESTSPTRGVLLNKTRDNPPTATLALTSPTSFMKSCWGRHPSTRFALSEDAKKCTDLQPTTTTHTQAHKARRTSQPAWGLDHPARATKHGAFSLGARIRAVQGRGAARVQYNSAKYRDST